MGVTLQGDFVNYGSKKRSQVKQFTACIAGAMDEAMRFAVNVGHDQIETSGTGYQGRRGRVVTGTMRDEFKGEVTEKSKTRVVGEFGWLTDSPFYAKFQEGGFDHYLTGKHVEGMFALRESSDQAWDEFTKLAGQCVQESFG